MGSDKTKWFKKGVEDLLYRGECPKDPETAKLFAKEAVGSGIDGKSEGRGKMLLGLVHTKQQMTPEIERSCAPGSSTAVMTSEGEFSAVVVSIARHFDRHGYKYGDILTYTRAAVRYWAQHGHTADRRMDKTGKVFMWLPQGQYTRDGRILTFYYHVENS